jgi:DNA-binding response OmpR family regulator
MTAKKRILVIEDEIDICTVLKVGLQSLAKWDVFTIQSAQEGLLLANTIVFDVILLDLIMPELDGMTVFRELKKNPLTREIPVIFITARTDKRTLNLLNRENIAGVIFKPFEIQTVIAYVNRILENS